MKHRELADPINPLQATLNKMEVALEAIADAVVWTGEDMRVQWCNAAFEQLINQPHSPVLGSKLSDLLPLTQAGQPLAPSAYPDVRMHNGEYETTDYEFRHRERTLVLQISGRCAGLTDDNSAVLVIQDITQPKEGITLAKQTHESLQESEERLRTSETLYRDLVETANSIILRWDNQGIIRFLNEYGQNFFGFEAREILGCNVVGTIVPQTETSGRDLQRLMADICQHPENHLLNENENTCKNGDRVWIVWANKPIWDEQGNLVEILSVGTDATERKQAEEALKAALHAASLAETRLNTILSSALASIVHYRAYANRDWNIDYYSPGSKRIWGYSIEELMADNYRVSSRIPPEDWVELHKKCFDNFLAERTFEHEYRYLHPDGKMRWICATFMAVRDEAADGWIVTAICTDISDRKQAEEALDRRAQAESLVGSISRQFIDQDVDTSINFTLKVIAQFIGVERSCIFEYSDDQSQFSLIHEWCATGIQPLSSRAKGTETKLLPWFHNQMFTGQVIQVSHLAELPTEAEVEKTVLENESIQSFVAVPMIHSGKVAGFLGVDVVRFSRTWNQEIISLLKLVGELIAIGRARHKAEEALRIAKDAAESANRSKSAFLANMSHELRTPLNAILGFAQLMERDAALTSRQRESLVIINRSGEHLLSLINDVLEMSKIEAGRIILNPTPFDLHQLLQTLREMFQVRTQAKQLSLQFAIAPGLPQHIITDEGKLRQVLINLLGNAVKFTQHGGVTLRASLEVEKSTNDQGQKTLHFEIQDTGRGIAPEEMDSLFQPFVQATSGIQAREGTGLGLTISRQFVRLMGGDIHFTSTLGQGSTCRFDVQVTLAHPPAAVAQSPTQGRVMGLLCDQPPYRILIVDDRPENRDLLAQLLNTVGFETRTAADGQEAIALWQTWHPHLIWMDMRMPVMDGYEATQQIKAMECQRWGDGGDGRGGENSPNCLIPNSQSSISKTVIIALTASAFEEQQANIIAAGCDDFVAKPFQESIIFEKMVEHLGVQYVYAEKQGTGENLKSEIQCLKSSDLTVMPAEWIEQLHQAAIEVDADKILQLIEKIPNTYLALAEGLVELVHHFCFDEILELTVGKDES